MILRQAAVLFKLPLHLIGWKFKFTDIASPDPTHLLKDKQSEGEIEEGRPSSSSTTISSTQTDRTSESDSSAVAKETGHSKWKELAEEGLQVYGLWLVGAAWDEKQ